MPRFWSADSDRDWEDAVGMYEEQDEFEEEPMDDVAGAVLARLNTAIMALKAAVEVAREDGWLRDNLSFTLRGAQDVEAECKRRLEL